LRIYGSIIPRRKRKRRQVSRLGPKSHPQPWNQRYPSLNSHPISKLSYASGLRNSDNARMKIAISLMVKMN
jgi:hypothetical protein